MKFFSAYISVFIFTGVTAYSQACYTVNSIAYNPDPFDAGTTVVLSDDAVSAALPLGFSFCYFGNIYTQFYIGSNGWIGFTFGQTTAFTTLGIPSTSGSVPKNCIMGPWQDWHPGITGGPYIRYQTLGVAPYRRLVVSYYRIPMFICTTTLGTFQIIIYETSNNIENHIQVKPNCTSWAGGTAVQGIHDLSGTVAVTVPGRNSTQWTTANEAYRYTPACVACVPVILPVELLHFTAQSNRNYIDLEWTTLSETNNDYFTVERSSDGVYFESISIVKGAGNSNAILHYKTTDEKPFNGTSYYRLKQTDFDGLFKNSEIVAVRYNPNGFIKFILSSSNNLNISYNSETSGSGELSIVDMQGRLILKQSLYIETGRNNFDADLTGLKPGLYLIRFFDEAGRFYSDKMIKT